MRFESALGGRIGRDPVSSKERRPGISSHLATNEVEDNSPNVRSRGGIKAIADFSDLLLDLAFEDMPEMGEASEEAF